MTAALSQHLCECGCGQPTKFATRNLRERGWVKGEPLRFLKGHRLYQHPGPTPTPASERIDKSIVRSTEDQCWIWIGAKNPDGYGIVVEGSGYRMAHRVAYERTHGPIPDGLVVRHDCDNPPCCNPAHLSIGTHADNSRDMVERGRSVKGEEHPAARLTDSEVREIFLKYKSGQGIASLAAEYGANHGTVWFIVNRRQWKHITEELS